MRQTINGADLRRLIISAAASIEINKQALNELNVFPVPDGDTGTNMSMTINAAASDLRKAEDPDLGQAAKIAASAMLRGARGNSGVILSLLFRGLSKRLKGAEIADGVLWADALQEGVDAAYKAVMKPAEGTILTVARLAASNCFGVKGMAARSVTDGVYHLLRKESMSKGVRVEFHDDDTISIDLHIIVDNGVNLTAVGASIISEVRYVVTKCTGTEVRAVNVYIDSMMIG